MMDNIYKTNFEDYKAIQKLHQVLNILEIPHKFRTLYDGFQCIFYDDNGENVRFDVVEHFFTYGCNRDLLEVMGEIVDFETGEDDGAGVEGYLSLKEVLERILKLYI